MSRTVTVKLTIPIRDWAPSNHGGVVFSQWLPMAPDDAITVERNGIVYRLWVDYDCQDTLLGDEEAEVPTTRSILLEKVYMEFVIPDLPDDLVAYMKAIDFSRNPDVDPVHSPAYRDLGERTYKEALRLYNRFIAYIRCHKGQYWLAEQYAAPGLMESVLFEFRARGYTDDGRSFLWRPRLESEYPEYEDDESRFVQGSDWEDLRTFVTGQSRPSLMFELLSGAEALEALGHSRSALTEAVTALEIVVSGFKPTPELESTWAEQFRGRVATGSLLSHIEHLGFSGSLKYLFPVIFTDAQIPTEVLRSSCEAVDKRNQVVHKGQRHVSEERLREYLVAIRQLCGRLQALSQIERQGERVTRSPETP